MFILKSKYFLKRVLGVFPLLLGISLISFLVMQLAPGDPTAMMVDPQISGEDLARIRGNLGLDQPVLIRYFYWLKEMAFGNFGYSFSTGQPVLKMIGDRLVPTLILSTSSLVLILIITFPLGLISGYKKGSRFDFWVTFLSFLGMSIPTFWLGLVLILGFSLGLGWFPSSGYLNPWLRDSNLFIRAGNIATHMVLPLITIVIGGIAGLTRYHRFGIISVLGQEYIGAARARGISERVILFKHAFKNAALPIITILGLQLPGLISGSFVIEYIFAWPGLGQLGVAAVFQRDYPVLMGTLFFSSVLLVFGNLIADMVYRWVDPRISS